MENAVGARTMPDRRIYSAEEVQTVREQIDRSIEEHALFDVVKRLLDIVFSLVALTLLTPVYLLIAGYVFFCDPHGSPVYRSIRCGQDGKPFLFLKFRTMYMHADQKREDVASLNEMDGPAFKISNDPRIIPKLRFLRTTSLDELLQFIHVLTGQMSVVGPRPPLKGEIDCYCEYERLRIMIKPGLTCYWQVKPKRNDCSFEEWLELDIRYILERNFLIDAKLVLKTIGVMINEEGR